MPSNPIDRVPSIRHAILKSAATAAPADGFYQSGQLTVEGR
jgi:hypothetical protein